MDGFCYGDLVRTPDGMMQYLWRRGNRFAFVPHIQPGNIIDPETTQKYKPEWGFREYPEGTRLEFVASVGYNGMPDFNMSPESMSQESKRLEWEYRLNLVRNGIPQEQKRIEAQWMRMLTSQQSRT